MIQELKYNGHGANPSDYECNDGDLAIVMDAVLEDGALKAVLPPKNVTSQWGNSTVAHIHETAKFKHYIWLEDAGQMIWSGGGNGNIDSFGNVDVIQVTSIGNTLVVLTTIGMKYYLWDAIAGSYTFLGDKLPECPLSFGLQGEMIKSDLFTISFVPTSEAELFTEFNEVNKATITEQVLGKVNKFIADNSTNKGRFIYPFLLRYAYRLYDGTLTMHSSPILMIASSDLAPQVFATYIGSAPFGSANLEIAAMVHSIDYRVVSTIDLQNLMRWRDIVSSVDVFVSKPIYTYDQNGMCTSFSNLNTSDCFCVCKHTNQQTSTATIPVQYQTNDFRAMYAHTFTNGQSYPDKRLILPRRSEDAVKNDIKNCSQFYFLESVKLENLATTRTIIPVAEDYLQSLVAREVMTDDYDSHDDLIPQYAFTYNARLNVTDMDKRLFRGHSPACLFSHTDGYVHKISNSPITSSNYLITVSVYVYIKQNGKDIVVKAANDGTFGYNTPFLFFYYPNINAYKAVVAVHDGSTVYYEIPLEKHAFLNGAFYFAGWSKLNVHNSTMITVAPQESDMDGRTIDIANKIYTSEVNNPFVFPLPGINTVGTGRVFGISSAARPLSEGQFGQFPLYAFTSEGVWALEVSSTGLYSAKQPITRDVCSNPESITQIDSAVLFATDRGIMLLSGSQSMCISDVINWAEPFNLSSLDASSAVIQTYEQNGGKLTEEDFSFIPFEEFIEECKMVYDYIHQRILILNFSVNYGYIYSLKSKAWGMFNTKGYVAAVNSYPEALVVKRITSPGSGLTRSVLCDFSSSPDRDITTMIVTRPFKFGEPNLFKTIDTIIQRGYFQKDNVRQILYASNDLHRWFPVWSSTDKYMRGFRGAPYKAFRLALICKLGANETLYGCSVNFNIRGNNQLR